MAVGHVAQRLPPMISAPKFSVWHEPANYQDVKQRLKSMLKSMRLTLLCWVLLLNKIKKKRKNKLNKICFYDSMTMGSAFPVQLSPFTAEITLK